MKYIQSFDSVNEANKGKVHRAAKKGSYPAVVVVVQDGKVIHQEPVSTPDVAPATFNVMQEKYPKALLHLEDNTGKRLFSESAVTEAAKIETERYVRSHGKKPKGYGGWMFSYNRDGSDEWQIPNGMSWPDAQKWAKKKAKEDGEDYVYVMESLVTEAKNTIGLAFKEEQDYLDFKEFVADQPRGAIRKNIGFDSKTKSWNVEMDVKVLDSIYGEGTPSDKKSGWYGGLPDDFESVIIESVVTEGKTSAVYKDPNTGKGYDLQYVSTKKRWELDIMKKGASIYSSAISTIKRDTLAEIQEWLDGYKIDSSWTKGLSESVVTEGEDTIGGLNKMANTDLERIADYADMIKDRMSQGQTLDAWMYSKISDSVKNLNSVHDTMDGNDGVNEAEDYKYKKYVSKAFDDINDAMFAFRNAMGVKQLGQADKDLKKKLDDMQASIFALQKEMKSKGLTESTVNEATDINDPVLVAFRRTRAIMELPKFKPAQVKSRRISFYDYVDLLNSQKNLLEDIKDKAEAMAQTLRDMEQEAEPEGGVMADKYGSIMMKQEKEYTQLKAKKAKIDARIEKYRMS